MNKQEFLDKLRSGLSGLPKEDVEERLTFYSEMIDDRTEEGLSEEEAVLEVGSVDEIVTQVISDIPLAKLAKERVKPKRELKSWEIVLLIIGAIIWFPLCIAIVSVIFSLYISVWSVIVSLWSVFVSLVASSFGTIISGIVFVIKGDMISGGFLIAVGIISAGLSIFAFYGCKAVTKGILILTKKVVVKIKNCFVKKEEAR